MLSNFGICIFTFIWLLVLADLCLCGQLEQLFLYTHATSTSHLNVVFNVASKMKAANVYDIRWPMTEAVSKHKAPEDFKSIIFNDALELVHKMEGGLYDMDESAWKSGHDTVSMFKTMFSLAHLMFSPCYVHQYEIPVTPCHTAGCNLTLVEAFTYLCSVARARSMNSDVVFVSALVEPYTRAFLSGSSFPTSYISAVIAAKAFREMSFFDRILNVISHQVFVLMYYQLEIAKLLLGPDPENLFKPLEPTMFIENTHRFLEWPVPITGALVRIGASKDPVESQEPLPHEMEQFMAGPYRGLVILSLSTYVSDGKMPTDVAEAFEQAFKNFSEYGFIWRTKEVSKPEIRGNIYLADWIPQKQLLADKRVVLLISHCGQNSFLEAIQNGVPIIGIPQMGDQYTTAKRVVDFSLGLQLIKDKLTFENIRDALARMLPTSREYSRAQKMKRMMETEEALGVSNDVEWWLNYRLRHGKTAFDRWIIPHGAKMQCNAYAVVNFLILLGFLLILSLS